MEVKNNEKIEIHKNKGRRKNNKRYYKAHDSVIKEILIAKQELIFLMRDFMKINLNKKDIENFNGEYRLKRGLKTRLLDVIYKIKTFFFINFNLKFDIEENVFLFLLNLKR